MQNANEWMERIVRPMLQRRDHNTNGIIKAVTVSLLTPQEFRDMWQGGLSLVIQVVLVMDPTKKSNDTMIRLCCKRLACGSRHISGTADDEDVSTAVAHILPPTMLQPNNRTSHLGLYVWPGDQSQGFQGYPIDTPLMGPFFTQAQLIAILETLGHAVAHEMDK